MAAPRSVDHGLSRRQAYGTRPPVKVHVGADHLRHGLSDETALCLHVLQSVELWEVAIRQRFVRRRAISVRTAAAPASGVAEKGPPRSYLHLRDCMPACPVEYQEDPLTKAAPTALANSAKATVNAAMDTAAAATVSAPTEDCQELQ